jgi:hypothetical protein
VVVQEVPLVDLGPPTLESARQQPTEPSDELGFVAALEVVLPHADHLPALGTKDAVDPPVTGLVGEDLLLPEGGIPLGPDDVLRASMPEATVHEHRDLRPLEYEVRSDRELPP